MKKHKVTFFVLSHTGALIRHATFSKFFLTIISVFVITCVTALGIVSYDNYKLKKNLETAELLKSKLYKQQEIITDQSKQIQNFAYELNGLKSKIVDLDTIKNKVCVAANKVVKPDQNKSLLLGMGGSSIPENLKLESGGIQRNLIREMYDQVAGLKFASDQGKVVYQSLLKTIEKNIQNQIQKQNNILSSTPSILPLKGEITSKFGFRKSPFTEIGELHSGLDISTASGTPIKAPARGIVTFAGPKGLFGNLIIIDHGHGIVTRYAHLNKYSKKIGDAVERGEVIGEVGNTGQSTGPHLHYEVHLHGVPVNPEKYIN
ncbi:MAG: M23 family metallopeptidase [Desulfobacterales bacterium]|nr:M23 family metallopeptidase [Desulfobacterales bacterium]